MTSRAIRSFSLLAILLCLLICTAGITAACAESEVKTFANVNQAVKYVKAEQPMDLTLEEVKLTPSELAKVKKAMPEGSVLHFSTVWGGISFTDEVVDLDLREIKGNVTGDDLEAVVALCPNLKSIDNSNKRSPSNNVMLPLCEKYPDIRFEWIVRLGKSHYCKTTQTAFSTFNEPFDDDMVTSYQMNKVAKYLYRLKALDLGHNALKDLEFLQYLPDLEFLIVGDNQIKDLTPISNLKHLKYLEIFSNYITDLTPLAECTELLDLNICYDPVYDFSPIDNLDSLERFWATMIRHLPEEEMQRFQEVHPDVEVDFKGSHATTNGWRKHPRYQHYIWCLKNNTWIPFDEPLPGETK